MSDDELMRMYRDGDTDAFDTLFDRYHAVVYNFAHVMLRNAASAEDMLQETFLRVARASGNYEARGLFRAWLMRIVRNLCLNRIKAERGRRQVVIELGLDVVEPVSPEPSPQDRVEKDENLAMLRNLIAELPERQREAIVLYAFEQMSYREIGGVLDVPVNTVKTLIHRARAKLASAYLQGKSK